MPTRQPLDSGSGQEILIQMEGLVKNFGKLEVLKGIDLNVRKGDVIVLIGPSGSGKSTLLRSINLLEKPTAGKIIFEGNDVTQAGKKELSQLRQRMGINEEMKEVTALKEVIVAGQDGFVYFYNLLTGEATRDPIELGAPSRGGLSVATNGTPILGVGQFNSRLANKTVKNGYHILNLVTNEKQRLIAGDGKDKNSNYTGFLGSALFDSGTGTMIVGGQNGVLYTAEFGPVKDTYNYQANEITLSETIQGYKTQVKGQDRTDTNINASVAVYNNYVYYGDIGGILQCVDLNTLTPVWAVDTGDSIESTPSLDV